MANFFEQFLEEPKEEDNFFSQYLDEPDAKSDVAAAADPVAVDAQEQSFEQPASKLDPAVAQEIEDRQAMIDMMGVDPYTGKTVSSSAAYMNPGFFDNPQNEAEYNRLKEKYPSQFTQNFQVNDETVTATADFNVLTSQDGREVLVPKNATEEQTEQALLTGQFTGDSTLPKPNRSMYDGFPATEEGRAAATALYQAYAEAGEQDGLGVVYQGLLVPPPDLASFSAPDLDFDDTISLGIYQGGKNLLETFAAVNDYLAAKGDAVANAAIDAANVITENIPSIGTIPNVDLTTDAVGVVDEVLPDVAAGDGGIVDALLFEGTQLLTGGVIGGKGGDKVVEGISRVSSKLGGTNDARKISTDLLKYSPKAANTVKVLSTEAGMAAALSPDIPTAFIGENAAIYPLTQGIAVDPDAPEYQQILANKANVLADALFAARTLQTGAKGVAKSAKVLYLFSGAATLTGVLSTASREKAFVDDVLNRLSIAADPSASADELVQIKRDLVKLIEDNDEIITMIDDDKVKVGLSTLAAVQYALRNNDTETAKRIITSSQVIEQGALGNKLNTGQLATKQGEPARVLAQTTDEMFDVRGGQSAVDQTGDALRDAANAPIRSAADDVAKAENAITDFKNRITSQIQNDPFFGSKLEQLNEVDGVSIAINKADSADAILDKLVSASRQMNQKKNDLFNKIKGGRLNIADDDGVQFGERLYDQLQTLNKEFLDAGNPKKPGNAQLGELLAVVSQMDRDEAIKFLSNKVTFEDLYTKIRPNLADTLNQLERDGSLPATTAISNLAGLKRLIDDDAILYLDETGQVNKLAAAQDAMDYYRNQYSKYWRDGGILQNVDNFANSSAGRLNQAGARDLTRQSVESGLLDVNRAQGEGILNVLLRSEGGQSVEDVVDYVIADAVSNISSQSGRALDEVDFTAVRQALESRASLLDRNPATKEAADQVRSFLRQIQRLEKITPELQLRLDGATLKLEEAKQQAYEGALGRFFQNAEGKVNPNTTEVLNKYFNDKQAMGVVDGQLSGDLPELLSKIDAIGDPVERELAQKGVEAAFSKFFKDKFLILSKEMPNQRGVSEAKITQELENFTDYLDKANLIFKNNPENVAGLETLLRLSGVQVGTRKATSGAGNSITADKAASIAAVNRLVTLTFGALSRIGARVRSGAVGFLGEKLDGAESARLAEQLLSKPQEFVKVARQVVPDGDVAMSQNQQELFYAWLVRSELYDDESEGGEQDFMMALADYLAQAENAKNNLDQQMQNLIGYQ
jgi:hypothetical protein